MLRPAASTARARDQEFKKTVDEIRNLTTGDEFTNDDWLEFKELFNYVLIKMGHDTLDKLSSHELAEFRKEVERIDTNLKFIEHEKDYEAEAVTMSDDDEIEIAEDFVPWLEQPEIDVYHPAHNGISQVYVDVFDEYIYGYYLPRKYIIEVSIVWYDEDHPKYDDLYDIAREAKFGRIQDIETIFIVAQKSDMTSERVSFLKVFFTHMSYKATYSGSQTWYVIPVIHYEEKITSFIRTYGQHPKLWVNTWNHMMSESDNNPLDDYPYLLWNLNLKHGNRLKTENEISIYWYSGSEYLKQSP